MRLVNYVFAALVALGLVGCGSTAEKSAKEEKQEVMASKAEKAGGKALAEAMTALYEVHKDGRIYIFYDQELYHDFIKTGHTAYMFSRIGSGPKGETMVFALTGEDKKKREGIPSVDIIDGLKTPAAFYGETINDGRIYVFGSYDIMADFRKTGEATYRFTDIGAGPNGQTVVYVLSKKESKKKPEALMALFKKMQ